MHKNVCDEIHELYRKKNHDYGDSFHLTYEKWGLPMVAIRLSDKLSRFETLIKAEGEVKDESIRDTLIDLSNYAMMAVMELDRKRTMYRIVCPYCGVGQILSESEVYRDLITNKLKAQCSECGREIEAEEYHE